MLGIKQTRPSIDRISQTLIVICLLLICWLFIKQPEQKTTPQYHYADFGQNAQLISVTPKTEKLAPGQTLIFSVSWRLSEPLPESHLIGYYVKNKHQQLTFIDTQKIGSLNQYYKDIPSTGIIFSDTISIDIPGNAIPGIYEVSTFIYPPDNHTLNQVLGSSLYSLQRTLFNVEISDGQ